MAVNTIYIPEGYSIEQVWAHIQRGVPVLKIVEVVTGEEIRGGYWVNVDEDGKIVRRKDEA